MFKTRNVLPPLIILLLIFMVGCASTGGRAPGISEMLPKQKVTMMYGVYNSQYSIYMRDTGFTLNSTGKFVQTSFPVLGEDKKIALREKRKILTQVYPLINLYESMVSRGEPISTDIEQQIFLALDALTLFIPG